MGKQSSKQASRAALCRGESQAFSHASFLKLLKDILKFYGVECKHFSTLSFIWPESLDTGILAASEGKHAIKLSLICDSGGENMTWREAA